MLRLGVQIVSISSRREEEGGDPKVWVDYAVKNYAQAGIDRVYFIGEAADPNRNLIESVADSFVGRTGWQRFASREYPARIFAHDGSERQVRNYLVVCRRPA